MRKTYIIIAVLAGIAIINAAYLSQKAYYFQVLNEYMPNSVCDLSQTVSCSLVLQSPYAKVFGVPFPWIALVVYPVILILAFLGARRNNSRFAKAIAIISGAGVLFNGFIMYREVALIHAFCILCFICTLIIISIFCISYALAKKTTTNTFIHL